MCHVAQVLWKIRKTQEAKQVWYRHRKMFASGGQWHRWWKWGRMTLDPDNCGSNSLWLSLVESLLASFLTILSVKWRNWYLLFGFSNHNFSSQCTQNLGAIHSILVHLKMEWQLCSGGSKSVGSRQKNGSSVCFKVKRCLEEPSKWNQGVPNGDKVQTRYCIWQEDSVDTPTCVLTLTLQAMKIYMVL